MSWVPIAYLLMSTISPGPVTFLTIQHSTRHGRFAGAAVALGGATTTAVFLLIALFLANQNLVQVSLQTAHIYQQVGAIILLALGLLTGYKTFKPSSNLPTERSLPKHYAKSYLTGLLLMAPFFPQAILFYTVILSHHVTASQLDQAILVMGAFKIGITLLWYTLLATVASTIRDWFFRPRIQQVFELGVSVFLIGTSLSMLV